MRPEYHKLIMADSMLAAAALIVFIVWGWQAAVCILFSALVLSSVFVSEIRRREAQASSLSDEIDRILYGEEHWNLDEYSEGELAILQDKVRKLVIRLREQADQLQKEKKLRLLTSTIMIVFSAFMQCYIMNVFMAPCNLISGGFTGLALLINKVCALVNINFPTQVGIIALNVPAAILCYKHISPRFTFLSCVQFFLVSFFISIFHFEPFFKDQILNVLFGGFLWGFSISLSLRAGGSTGGTDFIAQYVSSKIHRGIWDYVFFYNCAMIVIFGYLCGWIYAGYSILFQFLSTKTISSLYQRYAQITVEFTTNDPDPIIDAFMATCRHGMSVFECYGAYSHRKYYVCKAVISTYELRDVVDNVRKVDPKVLINTYNTVNFYGNFYQKPLE